MLSPTAFGSIDGSPIDTRLLVPVWPEVDRTRGRVRKSLFTFHAWLYDLQVVLGRGSPGFTGIPVIGYVPEDIFKEAISEQEEMEKEAVYRFLSHSQPVLSHCLW